MSLKAILARNLISKLGESKSFLTKFGYLARTCLLRLSMSLQKYCSMRLIWVALSRPQHYYICYTSKA